VVPTLSVLSRLSQPFLTFGRDFGRVLLQAPDQASSAGLDILTESQGIVMAGLGGFLPLSLRFTDLLLASWG